MLFVSHTKDTVPETGLPALFWVLVEETKIVEGNEDIRSKEGS